MNVFLKIVTSGPDLRKDRIVELSMSKIIDGRVVGKTRRLNPGIILSEHQIAYCGITNEELSQQLRFEEKAFDINNFLNGCDIVGFGIKNQILFLSKELERCGIVLRAMGRKIIDLQEVYMKMEPRDLQSASKFFIGKTVEDDALLPELMAGMLSAYAFRMCQTAVGEIVVDADGMSKITYDGSQPLDLRGHVIIKNGRSCFGFGKYNEQPIADCLDKDRQYYNWLIEQSEEARETKDLIVRIMQRYEQSKRQGNGTV